MAPIFDSDLAENRWNETKWENYELYEKELARERFKKRLWILATVFVFFVLSSLPVIQEHYPLWKARSIGRRLAREFESLKTQAALSHVPYRIRFKGKGSLEYVVEELKSCQDADGKVFKEGKLGAETYSLISPETGIAFGIPSLSESFCYDPVTGTAFSNSLLGFAVLPTADLPTQKADHIAVVVIKSEDAVVSFD